MIVFDNVTKYYKSNVGLEKVSVRINKGDFVFLVGPSGAGKSTFIKLILKEIDATSGSIKVRGREVTTMSNRQVPILRRNIGIVFQDFRLLPKKTVYENVAFAMEIIHQPKKLIKKSVPQVLSMVGIASKANKYPDRAFCRGAAESCYRQSYREPAEDPDRRRAYREPGSGYCMGDHAAA